MPLTRRHLVYLAGPTVFHPDAAARYDSLKALCRSLGFEGVAPIDGAVDGEMAAAALSAAAIRAANLEKIRRAAVVLADVTPFRGPGADDGTAWEMGYGEALGKIVAPYSENATQAYAAHVAAGPGEDGVLRDANGVMVEDFGLPANLMLAAGSLPVSETPAQALMLAAALLAGKRP